jgi:hypothetical protein
MTSPEVQSGQEVWAVQGLVGAKIWNRPGDIGMRITSGVAVMEWFLMSHLIVLPSVGKRAVAASETQMNLGSIAEDALGLLWSTTSRHRHTAIGVTERGAKAEKGDLGEMAGTDGNCVCTCLVLAGFGRLRLTPTDLHL